MAASASLRFLLEAAAAALAAASGPGSTTSQTASQYVDEVFRTRSELCIEKCKWLRCFGEILEQVEI